MGNNLMAMRRRVMMAQPHEEKAEGAVASFVTNLIKPLQVTCTLSPVQSGSGDPSPSNIRPISGWTGCDVYDEAEYDPSATPKVNITWQTEAGTVYGGTATLNRDGSVTVVIDRIKEVYDGVNKKCTYVGASGQTGNYASSLATDNGKQDNSIIISNMLKNNGSTSATVGNIYQNSSGTVIAVLQDQTLTTKEAVNTWLASNNLEVVHAIATPLTYTLSASVLNSLAGQNNVWADAGDVSVRFLKQ